MTAEERLSRSWPARTGFDLRALSRWRWLAVAAILLPFSNLRIAVPILAWLAPAALLRFLRVDAKRSGLGVAFLVVVLATAYQLQGMIPAPNAVLPFIIGTYALVFFLPFLADALMVRRVGRAGALLVFPLTWVVCEYGMAQLAPYGTWGSIAYTQYGNLPLIQLVSITGLYGVTFLIGTFATVWNDALEREFAWSEIGRIVSAFAAVLCAVLAFGGLRVTAFPASAPTVRIASLTSVDMDFSPDPAVRKRLLHGEALTAFELETIRERQRIVNDDLLRRVDREAAAGAKIVFSGETNASVLRSDEQALLRHASDSARRHRIYLLLGVATLHPGQRKVVENKAVLIDPEGHVTWQYLKSRPLPGEEAAMSAASDQRLKITPTPYGRLSAAICFDLDFPGLLRQAGRGKADILLAPSNDWRAIDPWHTQMAVFRAVEGGFNLVRHASNGLSLATDFQGRTLATMDHFRTSDRVMVAEVPTRGVQTLYSRFGDWFPLLCLAVLGALLIASPLGPGHRERTMLRSDDTEVDLRVDGATHRLPAPPASH